MRLRVIDNRGCDIWNLCFLSCSLMMLMRYKDEVGGVIYVFGWFVVIIC